MSANSVYPVVEISQKACLRAAVFLTAVHWIRGTKPKLTDEQARQTRQLVDGGESVSSVARSFGVSRQTVYRALERETVA